MKQKHLITFAGENGREKKTVEMAFESWEKTLRYMALKKVIAMPPEESGMTHAERMRCLKFAEFLKKIIKKGVFTERYRGEIIKEYDGIIRRRYMCMYIQTWIVFEKGYAQPGKRLPEDLIKNSAAELEEKWGRLEKKRLKSAALAEKLSPGKFYAAFAEKDRVETFIFDDHNDAMACIAYFICDMLGKEWAYSKGYRYGYNTAWSAFSGNVRSAVVESRHISKAKDLYNKVFGEKPGMLSSIMSMGGPYELLRARGFSTGKYLRFKMTEEFEPLKALIADKLFDEENSGHLELFHRYLKHIAQPDNSQ